MFRILLLLSLLLGSTLTYAQQVVSFAKADEAGLRTTALDSLYRSAVHTDTLQAVFQDQQAFIDAYTRMLQDLGDHLQRNGFEWPGPVRGFNRIYFAADGSVDHFLYSIRPGQISTEQEARFEEFLRGFVSGYHLPMKAEVPFAQCSPVTFMPKE
ncbi:MAG TPA: hypothetical protein VGE21_04600 [Flavobacteriales bacterium]